jgi:multidrug efflux pump subunit AcrB
VLERGVDTIYKPIERAYAVALRWVMRRRWVVVIAMLVAVGSIPFIFKHIATGFLPKNDEAQVQVNVRTPEGESLEATTIVAERIARQLRTLPEVSHTVVTIGDNDERTPNPPLLIFVRLVDPLAKLGQDEGRGRDPQGHHRPAASAVPYRGLRRARLHRRRGIPTRPSTTPSPGPIWTDWRASQQQALAALKTIQGGGCNTNFILGKPELGWRSTVPAPGIWGSGAGHRLVAAADGEVAAGLRLRTGNQYDVRLRADGRTGETPTRYPAHRASSKDVPVPCWMWFGPSPRQAPAINRLNRRR